MNDLSIALMREFLLSSNMQVFCQGEELPLTTSPVNRGLHRSLTPEKKLYLSIEATKLLNSTEINSKEVWLRAFLSLLPGMVMAGDVIQTGLFNKDPAIVAADGKGHLQLGANLSRKSRSSGG
jgi:hypothetical protein